MDDIVDGRGISVLFGGLKALDGVDLSIRRGEIFGVIGPNGAGKTTLVNVLTGISAPDTGELRILGQSIRGLKASQVATLGVRRTFQTTQLFAGMTVLENVMAGYHDKLRAGPLAAAFSTRRLREEEARGTARAEEALAFVDMAWCADRDARELSYGQQRLIEIARAIVGEPRLLLLDEPAVGLSLDRVKDLEDLVKRIRDEKGVTVLLIEHVIRVVMNLCDRVAVLSSGRKIADGTPQEVSQDEQVIDAYLGRNHAHG